MGKTSIYIFSHFSAELCRGGQHNHKQNGIALGVKQLLRLYIQSPETYIYHAGQDLSNFISRSIRTI